MNFIYIVFFWIIIKWKVIMQCTVLYLYRTTNVYNIHAKSCTILMIAFVKVADMVVLSSKMEKGDFLKSKNISPFQRHSAVKVICIVVKWQYYLSSRQITRVKPFQELFSCQNELKIKKVFSGQEIKCLISCLWYTVLYSITLEMDTKTLG